MVKEGQGSSSNMYKEPVDKVTGGGKGGWSREKWWWEKGDNCT